MDFREFFRDQHSNLELVMTNLPFSLDFWYPRRPIYLSVLRDPLDRGLSLYHFLHRIQYRHNGWQQLHVAGKFDSTKADQSDVFEFFNDQVRCISGAPTMHITEQLCLAAVRRILEEEYYVFDFADYRRAIMSIAKMLSIELSTAVHLNERPSTSLHVPPSVSEWIRQRNRWDLILYTSFAACSQ
jgi:hypothetical protein